MKQAPRWDRKLEAAILSAAHVVAQRWLLCLNAALATFIALALLAPLLMASGHTRAAHTIYVAYRITCHQEPQRSYFLGGPRLLYTRTELLAQTTQSPLSAYLGSPDAGYKLAFCQRDLATYAAMLLFGLLWPRLRALLPRLPLRAYALLLVPLAVDGLTQAAGLRESTWLLRTLTGGLFGLATAWLLVPELEVAMSGAARSLAGRLASLRPPTG